MGSPGGGRLVKVCLPEKVRVDREIDEVAVVSVPDALRREEVKANLKPREGLSPAGVLPEQVCAHCEDRLAAFKSPRYLCYIDGHFPRTPTRKIVAPILIAGADDLRVSSYDRVDAVWR